MGVDKRLSSGAIIGSNLIMSMTVSGVSSENSLFPASRLLDPKRSRAWRSANDTATAWVSFHATTAVRPTFVAIVNPNFASKLAGTYGSKKFRFVGAADSALTTDLVYWDLDLYQADPITRICRWYLDTPTSEAGVAGRTRNYWGFQVFCTGPSDYATPGYVELGALYAATYVQVPFADVQIAIEDPSTVVQTQGGADFSDDRAVFHSVNLKVPMASYAEWNPIRTVLDSLGGTQYTVLDLSAPWNDEIRKAQDTFYGKWALSGQQFGHQIMRRDISLQFTEARA